MVYYDKLVNEQEPRRVIAQIATASAPVDKANAKATESSYLGHEIRVCPPPVAVPQRGRVERRWLSISGSLLQIRRHQPTSLVAGRQCRFGHEIGGSIRSSSCDGREIQSTRRRRSATDDALRRWNRLLAKYDSTVTISYVLDDQMVS